MEGLVNAGVSDIIDELFYLGDAKMVDDEKCVVRIIDLGWEC